jgi:menaquinol-cytochrome c reductase iron-sulfur subunit
LSEHHDEKPHLPPPSLYPIGFAIGIACVLTGLVVSWIALAVGAAIALVFGFLWVRDVTRDLTREVEVEVEPAVREVGAAPAGEAPPVAEDEAAAPVADEEEIRRYDRSVFLELSTLGIGAAIGGIVTLPILGFAVLPSFTDQGYPEVDLGPVENYPEGQFVIVTYLEDPALGEVSRRTAYIRNNGDVDGQSSFTILYSRCVHLGCPVQPNGPVEDEQRKEYKTVSITPTQPSGFSCPCHGGAYDTEGRRTAGPPVRSLDRYEFGIKNGNLFVGTLFSVGTVEGEGAEAVMSKYAHEVPGVHVDGIEAWLYPIEVPQ